MAGWFEEQIELRKQKDDEAFEEACAELNSTITRKKRVVFFDDAAKLTDALSAILAYYGLSAREIPNNIKDVNDRIDYVCHPFGVMRRRVKLEKGWYKDAIGPMLAHKKDGTIVALIPDRFGLYGFYDGSVGKRVRLNAKTEKLLDEQAICFYKPFPLKKLSIKDLGRYVAGCITPVTWVMVVLMTFVITLVGMLAPKITHLLYSTVIEEKSLQLLLAIAVFSISVAVTQLLLGSFRSLLSNRLNTQMNLSVQAATMARILSLPTDFFKDYSTGELTAKARYIGSLCSTLVDTVFSIALTSVFSLIYITQIFTYAKMLVIPALTLTLITVGFTVVSSLVQASLSRRQMATGTSLSGMTYSMISGVQKIKLSGSEKRVFSRWLKKYNEMAKFTYSPPLFILWNGVISTAISLSGTIVMYYFALKSGVSVWDYSAFSVAYGMVSGAIMSLAGIALTIADIKPTLDMARPIMEAVPEIEESKKTVTKLSGNIELNNIFFRYSENMPYVLNDLSVSIKAGQYVAIVGKTGCGKSTLVRILLGFEKPQKGAVYYDGKDISTLDLQSLRRNIGCVMQNDKLMQGDIYSNIMIAAPQLTLDDAWKAAEIADIAQDIRDMPMGMYTVIAEGAGGISGGQKQRLMIARAVAPKPKILILDEATSALDNLTQKQVSDALDRLKCTRIVIAHRLSTIKNCDRIIVLDGGGIAEDGTYAELMEKKGYFYELVERQRLDKND